MNSIQDEFVFEENDDFEDARIQLKCDHLRHLPAELLHGTSLEAALGILKEGELRHGGCKPSAVYSVEHWEALKKHHLHQGFVFVFKPSGAIGSKTACKALDGSPVPAVSVPPGAAQRAAPEWRVHHESIQMLRMEEAFGLTQKILKAWVVAKQSGAPASNKTLLPTPLARPGAPPIPSEPCVDYAGFVKIFLIFLLHYC